jgi:leader peptidase (prepilin peptidase)/N-methyltransferase
MLLTLWLALHLPWLFLLGAAVGSFLNVCIYRIPRGKSLAWPGSRCGHCAHEVRLKDNIPLVSYWVLRGRCRDCGAPFSMRYFWVELLTAVSFVALYLLEIGLNVQQLSAWPEGGLFSDEWGLPPPHSWALFAFHAVLACFLITAAGCLLDNGRVPAPVAVTGTLAGLVGAVLFPWPFPSTPDAVARPAYSQVDGGTPDHPERGPMPRDESWADAPASPRPGFYAWPVWGPLPDALPAGSWRLGLVTGLAGALVGGWGLRHIARVARSDSAAGAADLSMIAGAFLGWQPALVAILLACAVAALLYRWRDRLPGFGLWLTLAVVTTSLGWAWVGPLVRPVLFSPTRLLALPVAVLAAAGLASALVNEKRRTLPAAAAYRHQAQRLPDVRRPDSSE